jgi:hypothetical protein
MFMKVGGEAKRILESDKVVGKGGELATTRNLLTKGDL